MIQLSGDIAPAYTCHSL